MQYLITYHNNKLDGYLQMGYDDDDDDMQELLSSCIVLDCLFFISISISWIRSNVFSSWTESRNMTIKKVNFWHLLIEIAYFFILYRNKLMNWSWWIGNITSSNYLENRHNYMILIFGIFICIKCTFYSSLHCKNWPTFFM